MDIRAEIIRSLRRIWHTNERYHYDKQLRHIKYDRVGRMKFNDVIRYQIRPQLLNIVRCSGFFRCYDQRQIINLPDDQLIDLVLQGLKPARYYESSGYHDPVLTACIRLHYLAIQLDELYFDLYRRDRKLSDQEKVDMAFDQLPSCSEVPHNEYDVAVFDSDQLDVLMSNSCKPVTRAVSHVSFRKVFVDNIAVGWQFVSIN